MIIVFVGHKLSIKNVLDMGIIMTLTEDEKFALLQDLKVIDNNRRIVERLNDTYELAKRNDYDIDKELCKIFQKILGERK